MDKSTSAKEQLEHWDKILDEYENRIGLPPIASPGDKDELEKYLSMDRNVIEKFTGDECAMVAYRLSQYAFYLQRLLNQETARLNWSKSKLKSEIASTVGNYTGYSYEERSGKAINGNEHAMALQKIAIFAQQRADRLTFLSASLKNLADYMKSIQFNKRGNAHD
jgi:hypothetical protein